MNLSELKFYIVIPAHNEAEYIQETLMSLANQTLLPKKIVVVDDHSTDATSEVISRCTKKFPFIQLVNITSQDKHLPGSKVIHAFYKGFETLDDDYDIICKFDADLIFPENYLAKIAEIFTNNPKCGMAGGFCTINKNGSWEIENLTNKDHVRGALKAYRKACFKDIGGLKPAMGWDTADELLAQFHGWEVITEASLLVKHLKPTGKTYDKTARYKQGEAFYRMRYGFWLTTIASLKLALKKGKPFLTLDYLNGYFKAKKNTSQFLVSKDEGSFIRKLRWEKIKHKFI
ncbi:glycosyl transferase family 2 [Planktosalinus lacus]|uniref:Glycosyl transferase family 2 n=1 Tax=Planktosalinus lacus TaxID=1526573 RepID=A0A8J2V9C9_9FLAO|nr:glycosyl transferase family 2 [Planktosalinus lacus]